MREAVIVAGARTPVGKAKRGSLATVRPDDFGALAIKETLKRAGGYDGPIDDLIIGCAMPEAEQGMNVARNIGALAGLPDTTPAITVNRFCSSGLQSIAYAAERIMLGHSQAITRRWCRIDEYGADDGQYDSTKCSISRNSTSILYGNGSYSRASGSEIWCQP